MATTITPDTEVFEEIQSLMNEQHDLRERISRGEASGADRERLSAIAVELGQEWDLVRQRRALRRAGQDPNHAQLRGSDVVSRFQQ